MKLSGWGKYPALRARADAPADVDVLRVILRDGFSGIARGLGRSYGDASLAARVILTRNFNRLISFDAKAGVVRCGGGVRLGGLLARIVPAGWFPAVVPGTRDVTVGGCVAADIHGKNHHRVGSFANHVRSLTVMLPDGEVVTGSREERPDLFRATCGGMGLTGVILEAEFDLVPVKSVLMRETRLRAPDLAGMFACLEAHRGATYSVAWLDAMPGRTFGRAVIHLGEHAEAGALRWTEPFAPSVPPGFPGFLLNRVSVAAFNRVRYNGTREGDRLAGLDEFFFPLDALRNWNRLYGRRGFLQYQFVAPKAAGRGAVAAVFDAIKRSGRGAYLAVLKEFGAGNGNPLSFPMEGWTLALDFPRRPGLMEFLEEADRIVGDFGGRVYLAKDARMGREAFRRGYPAWEAFVAAREKSGAARVFRSLLSDRLGI